MVKMKNGKPDVPAANNKQSQDIKQELPKKYAGMKLPKEMKTESEKIKIAEGFGNQFRNNNNSIDDPSKNAFQGNRSGK